MKLMAKVNFQKRRWQRGPVTLLDKLLRSEQMPGRSLAVQRGIRFVFLLHDPSQAAVSLLRRTGWPHSDDPETAAAYYLERMRDMGRLADDVEAGMAMALSYEALQIRPEACLSALSRFLRFSTRLSGEYPLHPWTGRVNVCDVSENIRAGKIVPAIEPVRFPGGDPLERELKEAHEATRQKMEAKFDSVF